MLAATDCVLYFLADLGDECLLTTLEVGGVFLSLCLCTLTAGVTGLSDLGTCAGLDGLAFSMEEEMEDSCHQHTHTLQ